MNAKDDFAALHTPGSPLILYNIWDAASAEAVERAGAAAIATGSHSLAGAQGYADGQEIPLEALLTTTRQIAGAINLPLTVDFEAGFAENITDLALTAAALKEAGAIGCNLEDQIIGGEGLREIADQAQRIAAVDKAGLFVNARTDTFLDPLRAGEDPNRGDLVEAAIERGHAYKSAGAGCYFIPGLSNPAMIAQIVRALDLPINVMRMPGMISNAELAELGAGRISYAGAPWSDAMSALEIAARDVFEG